MSSPTDDKRHADGTSYDENPDPDIDKLAAELLEKMKGKVPLVDGKDVKHKNNDIIDRYIKSLKEDFYLLNEEDKTAITIYSPPYPETLKNILKGIKKDIGDKRFAEYFLTDMGYKLLYKRMATSKFLVVQRITKRIRDTIGTKLIENYPKMIADIDERDNKTKITIHISQKQHEQLQEVEDDTNIGLGNVQLLCLICATNQLRDKFDVCQNSDIRYEKYCSTDGYLAVVFNTIEDMSDKLKRYIINALPVIKLSIAEREGAIKSGVIKLPADYAKKLDKEIKLRDDIEKLLEEDKKIKDGKTGTKTGI